MQIKKSVVIIALAALLIMPLASAGFFDFITGMSNANQSISANAEIISNNAPTILSVSASDPTIPAAGTGTSSVSFDAYDLDGYADLDETGSVSITKGGCASSPRGASCTGSMTNAHVKTYTCSVTFNYYDCDGLWSAEVSVQDASDATASDSDAVTLQALYSVDISPLSVNFSSLTIGEQNKTSTNNTLNNTGNMAVTEISMNSSNLQGTFLAGYAIAAGNFSSIATTTSGGVDPCEGSQLAADSYAILANDTLGTRPAIYPSENQAVLARHCLRQVPVLPRQNYTTAGTHPWNMLVTL